MSDLTDRVSGLNLTLFPKSSEVSTESSPENGKKGEMEVLRGGKKERKGLFCFQLKLLSRGNFGKMFMFTDTNCYKFYFTTKLMLKLENIYKIYKMLELPQILLYIAD